MEAKYLLILFITICIVLCDSLPKWVSKGYCQTEDDCPSDHCCVIGFTRYSVPQCMPLGQMGNWCRVYNEPQNKTLAYPNGQYFQFSKIYTQFCPCNKGLVCEAAKCAPIQKINYFESNFFDDY